MWRPTTNNRIAVIRTERLGTGFSNSQTYKINVTVNRWTLTHLPSSPIVWEVLVVFGWYQWTGWCYACQVLNTKCST